MFRIGKFSRIGRVSIKALRHYDDIGLLRPALVDRQTGYRYYSVKQLALLNRIVAYKSLGFSLEQSRALIQDDISTDEIRDLLKARRVQLAAAIQEQQAQLNEVEARILEIERQGCPPRYQVLFKTVGARPVVSLRRTVASYDAVDGLLAEIQQKLRGASAVEIYGAVWHRCLGAGSTIDCEAFGVINGPASPGIWAEVRQLPASAMACVVDENLDDAPSVFLAASRRAEANGYEITGPMHEIYVPVAGSALAVTEIQFPIRPAAAGIAAPQHN